MSKKLSASLLTFALVACVFAPAQAQNTMGLWGDADAGGPGGLSRFITTGTSSFEVVAVMKTAESSNAVEFIMTEIAVLFPSVFKLSTVKFNNALDLGDNLAGEYLLALRGCIPGSAGLEVVRVQYGDFGSVIPFDVVLTLRGFGPGDSQPSTFGGEMGFVDCNRNKFILTGEPWTDFNHIDPTKDPLIDSADGVLVLNADFLPNDLTSMGTLKSRF